MAGLEGTIVIDLTQYAAGPAASRALAEMGAKVIKVEPFTGDEQRTQGLAWGMRFRTEFDDVAYDCGSFNKEWTAIDCKNPEGKEVMLNLLSKADIFVTSLRSGALKRLGLDYETLHEKFPRLVWAQNRGYGEFGPLKDAKGFDATAFAARSGFVSAIPQNNASYEPGNSPIAFGDWNTGCALAAGILGAYACALKTGVGDKVTGSLYHVGTWGMTSAIIAQQQGCDYPKDRMEAKCPTNNSYVSSDGIWFLMCFGHYNKYHELVFKTLEMDPIWYTAEEYSTLEIMAENGKYVDVVAAMHKACKQFTFAELEKRFRENDIPFEKIQTVTDVLNDDEAFANDQLRKIPYAEQGYDKTGFPDDGTYTVTTMPFRLASLGDPVLYRSRPTGYDTRRILKEFGYTDAEVDKLDANGAVMCYKGEPCPELVLQPSYGPHTPEERKVK
ncbi:MAG: CoA transferase [Coriobacteriaceae bacterium]|nr:CoA transferase [Coriobacteriaceae bacterium]